MTTTKKKLDSSLILKEMQNDLKQSPFSNSDEQEIVNQLLPYFQKAVSLMEEENFYESANIFKALMEKTVEHLNNVEDYKGLLGNFLFNIFTYYTSVLRHADIDIKHFYEETTQFYLEEDLGFSYEIINLIVSNVFDESEAQVLDWTVKKTIKQTPSSVDREKLYYILLELYHRLGKNQKYIEICHNFSPNYWEKYVLMAQKYEQIGMVEKALETYEKGIQYSLYEKDLLKKRLEDLKNRILGLG